MEYIFIGILITLGSWFGGKLVDQLDTKPETVEIRHEVLQCVLVETTEEDIDISTLEIQ